MISPCILAGSRAVILLLVCGNLPIPVIGVPDVAEGFVRGLESACILIPAIISDRIVS